MKSGLCKDIISGGLFRVLRWKLQQAGLIFKLINNCGQRAGIRF
ncbi:MAG: hypothetical protein PUA92_06165 [Clostridium sp.]|nr:hypothetical protein [Clostridium sp.]